MTLRNKAPRDHSRSRPRASRVDRRAASLIGFRRSGRPWTQISRRVTGLWMLSKWNENANARLAARGGNSLFCTKHSLFFIGTGKACQGADLVWQSDRAGRSGGQNQSKIEKIPCYLPCTQGIASGVQSLVLRRFPLAQVRKGSVRLRKGDVIFAKIAPAMEKRQETAPVLYLNDTCLAEETCHPRLARCFA